MPKNDKLPARWESYEPLGQVIKGTRFIAFKVPLKMELSRRYTEELRFTPEDLVSICKRRDLDLGLVVDLTFTTRYYNPKELTELDVEYAKIAIPGHDIPTNRLMKSFFKVIDGFLEKNVENNKLIGVHCTHGVNRTGYLICRYMIEKLNIEPDVAIKAIGDARGYPIERENYLQSLRSRQAGQETEETEEEEEEKVGLYHHPHHAHQQGNNQGHYQGNNQGHYQGQNGYGNRHDSQWYNQDARQGHQRYENIRRADNGYHGNSHRGHQNEFRSGQSSAYDRPRKGCYDSAYNNQGDGYGNYGNYGHYGNRQDSGYGRQHSSEESYGQFGRQYGDNPTLNKQGRQNDRGNSYDRHNRDRASTYKRPSDRSRDQPQSRKGSHPRR